MLRWRFKTYVSPTGRTEVQDAIDRYDGMKTLSTKSDTKQTDAQPVPLATLPKMTRPLSSRTSARTSKTSTSRLMPSRRATPAAAKLKPALPQQFLSKSMEKTFLRMKNRASARHAYVEAEVMTGLAHQIRAVRMQRGLTQDALAKLMGTTQAAVSRLEDPGYGRYSIKTLLDLAKTFDTGLQVRFVSFVTMLHQTYVPSAEAREVPSFEDEAPSVGFYRSGGGASLSNYITATAPSLGSAVSYFNVEISQLGSSSKFISANVVSHQ